MNQKNSGLPIKHQSFETQISGDILRLLHTSQDGLAPAVAAERRLHHGTNELPHHEQSWLSLLVRQFYSPLVALLITAGIISFALGQSTDGFTIVVILLVNGLLGFVQEFRSQQALKSLANLLTSFATVRRAGQVISLLRDELVVGDIVLLSAGDAVPADLRLITVEGLQVDESTLTGEANEVRKTSDPLNRPTNEISSAINLVFGGTLIRHGSGVGAVIATGSDSVLGSIAKLVATTDHHSTFEKNVRQFSTFLMKIVGITLLFVLAVNLLTKGSGSTFPEELLFALALAISVIPEALPAVTTITFARGALNLAKQHVVVKRLSAIEDLGQIEVLCTDKTGTLTENRPTVATILADQRADFLATTAAAIAPSIRAGGREAGDPFDRALLAYLRQEGLPLPKGDILDEIPFSPERRRSTTLIREHGQQRLVVRGAPEVVLALCTRGFTKTSLDSIVSRVTELGRIGERAIAVAVSEPLDNIPADLKKLERQLTFAGVITFNDPIKASSRHALLTAERLGVEVKIVTGDSPEVAGEVARKLGVIRSGLDVVSGEQLDRLSTPEYDQTVRQARVFSRMAPLQKFKLIESLERQNISVGFLGEGINDAPALKLATVSLVVNSASDVAREAADIVLLDKSLQVVVNGIQQGRVIYANVLKYIKYTLIGNFGNFFAIAGISLITSYLPMLPVQILLTNLLTDFPLIAVAGDTVDPKEIRRPQHFRLRELGFLTLTLGLVSSLFDFIFFGIFNGQDPAIIQTMWFMTSILTELILIYSIRTSLAIQKAKTASATLIWLTVVAGLSAVVLPFLHVGQDVFHFVRPTGMNLVIGFSIAITYFMVTELVKRLYYRQYGTHPTKS